MFRTFLDATMTYSCAIFEVSHFVAFSPTVTGTITITITITVTITITISIYVLSFNVCLCVRERRNRVVSSSFSVSFAVMCT